MERSTTTPFDDDDIMYFGKHAGRRLEKVPASYLLWMYDKDDGLWQDDGPRHKQLREYIESRYDALRADAPDFEPCHPYRKPR